MNITQFQLDEKKCIGCGLCTKVCSSQLIFINSRKKAQIKEVSEFSWTGCWKCQHCMAVCPQGALSILGKQPEDSLQPADPVIAAPCLDSLITNRRSCRRYLDKNVDKNVITEMLSILQSAPTGGNKMLVEYTLIDDKDQMAAYRRLAYGKMEEQAKKGVYPPTFDAPSYAQMKEWEQEVRPDMLFCSAPHLLIPHAPVGKGCWVQDVNIACSYFELLCASRGLGAIMMTFPIGAMSNNPELREVLEIPEDHYIGMMIGFGYPEITYARGVQKGELAAEKVKVLTIERNKEEK